MNRRELLQGAAALGAASVLKGQSMNRKIRSLLVEGVIAVDTVLGEQPLELPSGILNVLSAGGQLRIRVTYPHARKLLLFYGFLALPDDPPSPLPDLQPGDPRIFTILALDVDKTYVSFRPEPTFGLFGSIFAEPVPSPFFPNLTGRVCGMTAAFQNEGTTTFKMAGVIGAGSHATYARTAAGFIELA